MRRDVFNGRVWSAAPHRVVDDDGTVLRLACWPGIESMAPTTWIHWLITGDDTVRKQAIPNLVRGRWQLGPWVWRDNTVVSWFGVDPDFSIHLFTPVDSGASHWYVNFERPVRRTAIGIDTCDLMLDLVADPDLRRWSWKDEDEYAQGRRLGLITDADHRRVSPARERAVALLETRGGPFAQHASRWQVRADWPIPVLPPQALSTPATP
ncbi:DUF402 domain-containing protein [Actinoplanes sp. NPDC026623]|uniref:DUF402 domain-containing protein n=1 Tax=Actinoplanes sp. NPDC026623 TaxID=3155610 RepID=UPI0033EC9805